MFYQSKIAIELSSSYPTVSNLDPSGENSKYKIALKWNSWKLAKTSNVVASHTNISIALAFPA